MFRSIWRKTRKFFRKSGVEIEPDEIFLDSSNLPNFDRNQFEGRIEKPISKSTIIKLASFFAIVFIIASFKTWTLQIREGEAYSIQSEINRLRHALIFSERGIIYDRNNIELAWNSPSEEDLFARREYIEERGMAHTLGYISYPLKDSMGVYYQDKFVGIEGIENNYNDILSGSNGLKIIEMDALGEQKLGNIIRPPRDGNNITLSIDSELQSKMYSIIRSVSIQSNFKGGSAVIMDVKNGEILAITSYPEYDSNVLSSGDPKEEIAGYVNSDKTPFLNRTVSGLYTPGSIVKPFIAIGALNEGIITPEKKILSTGSISIPNPFIEGEVSVFKDWKEHGYLNMVEALGVSSNVYFYEVGGGFEGQRGLGIGGIEKYARMFGMGKLTNVDLPSEALGVIPNPEWKEENFPGDIWRIGDTYHTAIGQYGFQVTPVQIVSAIGAIANGGKLLSPTVVLDNAIVDTKIPIKKEYFDVVREGMRYSVTNGTGQGINLSKLEIAAKTGTAEVGVNKEYVNSWTTGFFPYKEPKYAFVVLMERAPSGTIIGSVSVAKQLFEWMIENKPEYINNN